MAANSNCASSSVLTSSTGTPASNGLPHVTFFFICSVHVGASRKASKIPRLRHSSPMRPKLCPIECFLLPILASKIQAKLHRRN